MRIDSQDAATKLAIKLATESIIRDLVSAVKADLGKLVLLEPDGNAFFAYAGIGWSDDTFESARIPVSDRSLAGYVVATRGAVIFENLPQSKRFRDAELLLKHGVVSSIGVAVRLNDTAVGVLSVHTRVQQTFTSEQITRVERAGEALGELLATA
jgi:GAF domain-containing protein